MVELTIDPEIKARFDMAAKNNTVLMLSDFNDKVQNSPAFMKKLQNLILVWSKDIRKLNSMEHAIEKGTSS